MSESGELRIEGSLQEGVFDRSARTIRGLVLMSGHSLNNREYTPNCMENAVGLFENAQVYVNHPNAEEQRAGRRDLRGLAGRITTPRLVEGKIKADAVVLNSASGQFVLDLAENMPTVCGLSINAEGMWRRGEGGKQIVEQIKRVHSVDVVDKPAATKNLFESQSGDGQDAPIPTKPMSPDEARRSLLGERPGQTAEQAKASLFGRPAMDVETARKSLLGR